MDDRELYRRLLAGEEKAFEEFFLRHRDPLIRTVVRLIGDPEEAQHIAQEAFLKLFEWRGQLDPTRPIKAWLYQVALNKARNWLRGRSQERKWEYLFFPPDPASWDPSYTEDERQLIEAFDRLPEQHREILLLVYVAGLSAAEIAEVCGIDPAAARQRLHRARNALRDGLVGGPPPKPDEKARTL